MNDKGFFSTSAGTYCATGARKLPAFFHKDKAEAEEGDAHITSGGSPFYLLAQPACLTIDRPIWFGSDLLLGPFPASLQMAAGAVAEQRQTFRAGTHLPASLSFSCVDALFPADSGGSLAAKSEAYLPKKT